MIPKSRRFGINEYLLWCNISSGSFPRLLNCDLCGENEFLLLREDVSVDVELSVSWPVYVCDFCGLIQQNPRMDQDFYKNYYAKKYSELLKSYSEVRLSFDVLFSDQILRGKNVLNYILPLIKNSTARDSKLKVLDVGCSAGGMLYPFQEKGWEVFGNDPDEASIAYGRSKGIRNLENLSAEEMIFEIETFDVVMIIGSLEHVFNLKKVLDCCMKYLKVGGLIIISGRGYPIKHSSVYFNHHHHRYFNSSSLEYLFENYNLDPIDSTNATLLGEHRKTSIIRMGRKKDLSKFKETPRSQNLVNKKGLEIIEYFSEHDRKFR
jgi:2-polyprenyl-3-methyl-5-hydroxy-6-metoxy-1,4-benzoquinol methylase